jgi:hypothetical protein
MSIGLEDVDLLDHDLHDRPRPFEGGDGAVQPVGTEVVLDLVELVEQQLEPELVGLVADDEDHLVVLGRLRARHLQSQELIEMEVAGIG